MEEDSQNSQNSQDSHLIFGVLKNDDLVRIGSIPNRDSYLMKLKKGLAADETFHLIQYTSSIAETKRVLKALKFGTLDIPTSVARYNGSDKRITSSRGVNGEKMRRKAAEFTDKDDSSSPNHEVKFVRSGDIWVLKRV